MALVAVDVGNVEAIGPQPKQHVHGDSEVNNSLPTPKINSLPTPTHSQHQKLTPNTKNQLTSNTKSTFRRPGRVDFPFPHWY